MAYDPTLIKICGSVLRMDRRVCRTEAQCSWYEPDHDGKPCHQPFNSCDMVINHMNKSLYKQEWEHKDAIETKDAKIGDLEAEVMALDEKVMTLKAQLKKNRI